MKIKNKIHKQILENFEKFKNNCDENSNQWVQHYLGSNKPTLGIKTGEMIKMARKIAKKNNFNKKGLVELLDSLYSKATTFAEIDIAARLLGVLPKIRQKIEPEKLDYWLNYTQGWAENDVLCQSNFTSEILLSNWSQWKKILKQFNQSSNINKRRASMVLLTKSLRQSDDDRLSKLAFENIENLKSEKEILITKAVSWLLRSLVKFHEDEVAKYIEDNKESLPKIAYRETLVKINTGRKN